jgi:hypothetical protein
VASLISVVAVLNQPIHSTSRRAARRESLVSWQSTNIRAAATFLRARIAAGDDSPATNAIYQGLLEVLDPSRRAARVQREMAAAVAAKAERERRAGERRRLDRRKTLAGPKDVERRFGIDRRSGKDRRNRT